MKQKELLREIQNWVKENLFPLFESYHLELEDLAAALKWKPIVVIFGNYSSGKSTLINEILEQDIQRTGQAPTDDSFTIITAPEPGDDPGEIPGASIVNDERLPFGAMKDFGEQLIAHFHMKRIQSSLLEDLAIIDSPGMLDSVTEKGRGYDFAGVIGELAKLADLVVLMFDPHKAGTIKETYTTIRNTLPETSGEDRIVFVMSRIDECDNLADLVRSYGNLCWNLSQMTGRKDIPRVFLTFAPKTDRNYDALEVWRADREELKRKILAAPGFRTFHILHKVDKQINLLALVVEAMATFSRGARRLLARAAAVAGGGVLFSFFLLDLIYREFANVPLETFLSALLAGTVTRSQLVIPGIGAAVSVLLVAAWFFKLGLPGYVKRSQADIDRLVRLDTTYRQHVWAKLKAGVAIMLTQFGLKALNQSHLKNLVRIEKIIKKDLQYYFTKAA